MSFLIDTDICSAYIKGHGAIFNRFVQHGGALSVAALTAGELYSWAYRANASARRRRAVHDLLASLRILVVDHAIALTFGQLRAALLDQGLSVPTPDLLIASTALVHDLTIVTHNVRHFWRVPGLRVEDWLA